MFILVCVRITITCSEEGMLRINLKATYVSKDFSVEKYTHELSNAIVTTVNGLYCPTDLGRVWGRLDRDLLRHLMVWGRVQVCGIFPAR